MLKGLDVRVVSSDLRTTRTRGDAPWNRTTSEEVGPFHLSGDQEDGVGITSNPFPGIHPLTSGRISTTIGNLMRVLI